MNQTLDRLFRRYDHFTFVNVVCCHCSTLTLLFRLTVQVIIQGRFRRFNTATWDSSTFYTGNITFWMFTSFTFWFRNVNKSFMTSYLYQRLGRQLFELAEVVMTTAATAKLSACISRLNFPWLVPYYICFNLSREEMTKGNVTNMRKKSYNPFPKSKCLSLTFEKFVQSLIESSQRWWGNFHFPWQTTSTQTRLQCCIIIFYFSTNQFNNFVYFSNQFNKFVYFFVCHVQSKALRTSWIHLSTST